MSVTPEFMNKRAEETKDEVLKRKAIEYWNWNEPIIEELQTPDRWMSDSCS